MAFAIFLLAAAVLGLVYLTSRMSRSLEVKRFMVKTSSSDPPKFDGGLLGLRGTKETAAALGEGTYFALSCRRFAKMGHTYQGVNLGQTYLTTIHAENLKAILSRVDDFTTVGRQTDYWPLLRGGILLANGKEWKMSRALIQPAMAKSRVHDSTYMAQRVSEMLAKLPTDGSTIDLQTFFQEMTFHASIDYLCGERRETSASEAERDLTVPGDLQASTVEAGRRSKIGFFCAFDPVVRPWAYWRYIRASLGLNRYFGRLVDERLGRLSALREKKSQVDDGAKPDDEFKAKEYVFLDHLAAATDDTEQIKWELATAMAAGRDTTSSLLSHLFWELSRRPGMWAELRQEVERLEGRPPQLSDLNDMVYLKALINEGLRMYSSIPVSNRWAARDISLPKGGGPDGESPIFVPAGRRILMSYHGLHHDPSVWGPDADEFKPERWLARDPSSGVVRLLVPPAWTFLPFSNGPRNCPGQHYVFRLVSYTMVRMAQSFRGVESRDDRGYAVEASVSISMKYGTLVGLLPAC